MLPTDLESLRAAVGGRKFRYVFFWGHSGVKGVVDKACLSQWAPVAFTVDGVRYPTAEHWMMAEKARLFGDEVRLAQIIEARHPKAAKALGRKVQGFVGETWLAHRRAIVTVGNQHKFAQNPAEAAWLRGTNHRVLVEASPMDRVWGIGFGQDAPEAQNPRLWRGLNLLGFALMDVRAGLLAQ
jgi:hypothetical protein